MIVEPVTEKIATTGNTWTSNRFLLERSGLQEGAILNSYDLQSNIAWLNRSPFRQTDVVLSPGEKPGTTQAELVTEERFPFRYYVGADNTGTEYLQHTRLYTGFNVGHLWWDHQASFQWTFAPSWNRLMAFSGQYLAPLPFKQQILLFGGYSKFKGDLPFEEMSQTGKAWQISGRYQVPIAPIFGNLLQQLSFGYDFKRTNSELLFGGLPFQEGFADINQFNFGYTLDVITKKTKSSLLLELIAAPFQMTNDQTNHDFQKLRPFAKATYAYSRMRFSHTSKIRKDFSIRFVLAGQLTGWNLLASEQFPLGGFETVRGYEERAFNADNGVLASVEFATPNLGYFKNNHLEFLGFVDYGWGNLHKTFAGQKKSQWLLGIGPGIRYRYRTNIVLRGDIGVPFNKAGTARHGTHYYGGVTVSY